MKGLHCPGAYPHWQAMRTTAVSKLASQLVALRDAMAVRAIGHALTTVSKVGKSTAEVAAAVVAGVARGQGRRNAPLPSFCEYPQSHAHSVANRPA